MSYLIIGIVIGLAIGWFIPPPAMVTRGYTRLGEWFRQKLGG